MRLILLALLAASAFGQTASQAAALERLKAIHIAQPAGYSAPDGGVYQHKLAVMLGVALAPLQSDITAMIASGWVEVTVRPASVSPGVRILTAGITAINSYNTTQQAAADAAAAAAAAIQFDADTTAMANRAKTLALVDKIPAGVVVMVTSSCPVGFSELATTNGRMLVGTLAINANVGTTGGSDNVTPTFTGNALANHAHELPFQFGSATNMRQIAAATFGTGTSRAATSQQAHTANTTSAAVALSQAVSGGTPAGTISAIDNRSAFIRVIFCIKT